MMRLHIILFTLPESPVGISARVFVKIVLLHIFMYLLHKLPLLCVLRCNSFNENIIGPFYDVVVVAFFVFLNRKLNESASE